MAYFSSNSIALVIRSHDKYQSLILVGLARTGKASSGIQSILFHYRSYWREWRPLVTPWAGCIKEGIEPRKSQKWFFPSHAQVSVSLCSLLLLLFCFCFCCYYYCYYYYYVYLLAKGFYYSSGYENKSGPYYSNGYEYKPRHFNSKTSPFSNALSFSLLFSLSLFSGGHYMCSGLSKPYNVASRARCIICVHGYLTHIISTDLLPLLLVALLSLSLLWWPLYVFRVIQTIQCSQQGSLHYMCSRLSNPYNINSLAPHFCSLLFSLSLLWWPLYVFRVIQTIQCHQQGSLHYMCSRLSNTYNINSLASHFCSLLSFLTLL